MRDCDFIRKSSTLPTVSQGLAASGSREQKVAAAESLQAAVAAEGAALSQQRREAAGKLRCAVEGCLADLAMSGARFDVRIGWEQQPEVRACLTAQPHTACIIPQPHPEDPAGSYMQECTGLQRMETFSQVQLSSCCVAMPSCSSCFLMSQAAHRQQLTGRDPLAGPDGSRASG